MQTDLLKGKKLILHKTSESWYNAKSYIMYGLNNKDYSILVSHKLIINNLPRSPNNTNNTNNNNKYPQILVNT